MAERVRRGLTLMLMLVGAAGLGLELGADLIQQLGQPAAAVLWAGADAAVGIVHVGAWCLLPKLGSRRGTRSRFSCAGLALLSALRGGCPDGGDGGLACARHGNNDGDERAMVESARRRERWTAFSAVGGIAASGCVCEGVRDVQALRWAGGMREWTRRGRKRRRRRRGGGAGGRTGFQPFSRPGEVRARAP